MKLLLKLELLLLQNLKSLLLHYNCCCIYSTTKNKIMAIRYCYRDILQRNLDYSWRHCVPERTSFRCGGTVFDIASDSREVNTI